VGYQRERLGAVGFRGRDADTAKPGVIEALDRIDIPVPGGGRRAGPTATDRNGLAPCGSWRVVA
jgi:hypothetical protein